MVGQVNQRYLDKLFTIASTGSLKIKVSFELLLKDISNLLLLGPKLWRRQVASNKTISQCMVTLVKNFSGKLQYK